MLAWEGRNGLVRIWPLRKRIDMAQIVECSSCHKRFAFKSELAGKRVKCKCGGRIQFPAEPPPDVPLPQAEHAADADDAVESVLSAGRSVGGVAGGGGVGGAPVPRPFGSRREELAVPIEAPPDMFAPDPTCPNCKQVLREGSVLCTACGYDLQSGKMISAPTGEQENPAPSRKRINLRRLALVTGMVLLVLCAAGIGTLWLFGAKIPGARKLPVVGWFASTRFDTCRFLIPTDVSRLQYFDVRALRKSQFYLDNKDTLDGQIGGFFPKDKSLDAIDRYVTATGDNGTIKYYRFNADQPKERIFPPGRTLPSGTLYGFTIYALSNGEEALWLDSRQLLLGNHNVLVLASDHYLAGDEAAHSPEMIQLLDAINDGDLITAQGLGGPATSLRAKGSRFTLGGTVKFHAVSVFANDANAASAVEPTKKLLGAGAKPFMKDLQVSQHGRMLDMDLAVPYDSLGKSLKDLANL